MYFRALSAPPAKFRTNTKKRPPHGTETSKSPQTDRTPGLSRRQVGPTGRRGSQAWRTEAPPPPVLHSSSKETETETLDKRGTEAARPRPPSFLLCPSARDPHSPPSPLRSIVRPRVSAASSRGEGPGPPPSNRRCPGSAGDVRAAMDAFWPAPAGLGRAWPRIDVRDLVVKVSSPSSRPRFLRRAFGRGGEVGECRE